MLKGTIENIKIKAIANLFIGCLIQKNFHWERSSPNLLFYFWLCPKVTR